MSENKIDYREAWSDYEQALGALADDIEAATPRAGEGTLNGREWCDEHDVPEVMFAHAVEHADDRLDYGVSPMAPWVIDYE